MGLSIPLASCLPARPSASCRFATQVQEPGLPCNVAMVVPLEFSLSSLLFLRGSFPIRSVMVQLLRGGKIKRKRDRYKNSHPREISRDV